MSESGGQPVTRRGDLDIDSSYSLAHFGEWRGEVQKLENCSHGKYDHDMDFGEMERGGPET